MGASSGFVLWFTGLSGAGKSTLAASIAPLLEARETSVEVLDGDEIRAHLHESTRPFAPDARRAQIRIRQRHVQKRFRAF